MSLVFWQKSAEKRTQNKCDGIVNVVVITTIMVIADIINDTVVSEETITIIRINIIIS